MLLLSKMLSSKLFKTSKSYFLSSARLADFECEICSLLAISHFVIHKIIFFMPRNSRIFICSKLWAFSPSVLLTTSKAPCAPKAPEIIVLSRFSCPGTSIKAIFAPFFSKCEKLRSIVIPRRFSSSVLSPSKPFSAFIRAVLPWSICPALASKILLILPTKNAIYSCNQGTFITRQNRA